VSEQTEWWRQAWSLADERTVGWLLAAVGVRAEAVRRRLQRAGLAFVGRAGAPPEPWELDRTAEVVIGWSRANVGLVGGMTGLGGLLGVPPEIAARLAATVRLAQRLAVVYGLDPDADRGRIAVSRALAAAYGVELPPGGIEAVRLRELASMLTGQAPDAGALPGQVATAMVVGGATRWLGRLGRVFPVLSSAVSAVEGQQAVEVVGRRMVAVLRRIAEIPDGPGLIEEAVEIRRG
jgi:hypothetical protein